MKKHLFTTCAASLLPLISFAQPVCRSGGQIVQCPAFLEHGAGWLFALVLLFWVFGLILAVLTIVAQWFVFKKAGLPGWAAIIPVYNMIVLLQTVNRPWWWIFMFFIPVANIVFQIITLNDLSKSFGKGPGFTVGLVFLPFVFLPILGFGKAQYTKPMREQGFE